jgi:hypothetical protein
MTFYLAFSVFCGVLGVAAGRQAGLGVRAAAAYGLLCLVVWPFLAIAEIVTGLDNELLP